MKQSPAIGSSYELGVIREFTISCRIWRFIVMFVDSAMVLYPELRYLNPVFSFVPCVTVK
jgi:hypothetical protein